MLLVCLHLREFEFTLTAVELFFSSSCTKTLSCNYAFIVMAAKSAMTEKKSLFESQWIDRNHWEKGNPLNYCNKMEINVLFFLMCTLCVKTPPKKPPKF